MYWFNNIFYFKKCIDYIKVFHYIWEGVESIGKLEGQEEGHIKSILIEAS